MPFTFINSEGEREEFEEIRIDQGSLAKSTAVFFLVPFPSKMPKSSVSVRD
jgi:hypothetical protein